MKVSTVTPQRPPQPPPPGSLISDRSNSSCSPISPRSSPDRRQSNSSSTVWTALSAGAAFCLISACSCVVSLHNYSDDSVKIQGTGSKLQAIHRGSRHVVDGDSKLRIVDRRLRQAGNAEEAAARLDDRRTKKKVIRPDPSTEHEAPTANHGKQATKRGSSTDITIENREPKPHLPFYLYGRYSVDTNTTVSRQLLKHQSDRRSIIETIYDTQTRPVVNFGNAVDMEAFWRQNLEEHVSKMPNLTWALSTALLHSTRNHDCVMLFDDGDSQYNVNMVNVLGRYNRHVEVIDLITGHHRAKTTEGTDPAGNPLNDLNHVSAVLVDSLQPHKASLGNETDQFPQQEIWLPCGFHNDAVNNETSSEYARIIDVESMTIRAGPKLPSSGGACTSAGISIIPDEPPMICSFAGTRGKHDSGEFLPQTQCYDRIRERWWSPFGEMPYGLDHGNIAVIPRGLCQMDDPTRVLIFNFRTEPYGDTHSEMFAHDLPENGWTVADLTAMDQGRKGAWYVYHNISDPFARQEDVPRDAAGIVVTDGGRRILNFGGQAHSISKAEHKATGKKRRKIKFGMIRSLDVCEKKWSAVGDLGLSTFALQSCASERLQVAITCGGEAPLHNSNSDICFASHWESMRIENQHQVIL